VTPAEELDTVAAAELGEEAGAWFCTRVADIAAGFQFMRKGIKAGDVRQADAMASAYALVLSDLRRSHVRAVESRVRFIDDDVDGRLRTAIAEIEDHERAAARAAVFASIKWNEGVDSKLKEATVGDICEALAVARGEALHELRVGRRSEPDVPLDRNVALVVAALSKIGITEAVDTSRKRMMRVVCAAARDAGCRRTRKFSPKSES